MEKGKTLFIVESPNKIKTLKKFLGSDFVVKASVGHVREIPPKGLNIKVKEGFEPIFKISSGKVDVVSEIKREAKKASEIILATDDDMEGEAISWHIYDLLDNECKKKCKRVTFNAITKKDVTDALKNKKEIDMDKVNAQKARQVLDRLIGYRISPLLCKAVASKTSAGRVQSIALKILSEREIDIKNFKPEDFWYIDALLKGEGGKFWARVQTKDKDNRYLDESISRGDVEKLKKSNFELSKVTKQEKKSNAYPPFDTSSLQTSCSSLFGWGAKKTASYAQNLYSKGFTTYVRTDSFSISGEALTSVREYIKGNYDKSYLSKTANIYSKGKKSAQEAHECIRPTNVEDEGHSIDNSDEKKLYELIRKRFIACQMAPCVMNTVVYEVDSSSRHKLVAKGQSIKFEGWRGVYDYSKTKEEILPDMKEKTSLNLKDINKSKHSTQPPPRYNEGSLIKKMEKEGVGRPSTYPSIMESIQKRGYVVTTKGKKGQLEVTDLGLNVEKFLNANFSKDFFMDIQFTSGLEDELDLISSGENTFLETVQKTYDLMMGKIKDISNREGFGTIATDEPCQKCKKGSIVERHGKFGKFYSCDQYPSCKTIYVLEDDKFKIKKPSLAKNTGVTCTECKKGKLVERKNRKDGTKFYGCTNYPSCKNTLTEKDYKDLKK